MPQSLSFQVEASNFIKKETLTQVFSCEFCEISKNIFFTVHLWATASQYRKVDSSSWYKIYLLMILKHEKIDGSMIDLQLFENLKKAMLILQTPLFLLIIWVLIYAMRSI